MMQWDTNKTPYAELMQFNLSFLFLETLTILCRVKIEAVKLSKERYSLKKVIKRAVKTKVESLISLNDFKESTKI